MQAEWRIKGIYKADAQKVADEIGEGKVTPQEVLEKANEYFKNNKEVQRYLTIFKSYHSALNEEFEFRTLDYVKENCKHIVDQVIEFEKESEE